MTPITIKTILRRPPNRRSLATPQPKRPNMAPACVSANAWLAAGKADAVAFGVPFIANPDLPARLKADAPLNEARPELFYAKGPIGYIDYPTL